VALVGRPNAGKSTLMNRLLAEKVAIVSDKPQTTRNRMIGVLSDEHGQLVFFDTPGIHRPLHRMNRGMLDEAHGAMAEADLLLLIRDASQSFGRGDAHLLELVESHEGPRLAVLNKIDLVRKERLLPEIARYAAGGAFEAIVPISASTGDGVDRLLEELWRLAPEGEPMFDEELLTPHSERFLVAERIREKILEITRDELPFSTAVLVEAWEDPGPERALRISAALLVERPTQKGILVGRRGDRIRSIGTAARHDIEAFLERKVFLDLHVRVERDWREDPRLLSELAHGLHGVVVPAGDDPEPDAG